MHIIYSSLKNICLFEFETLCTEGSFYIESDISFSIYIYGDGYHYDYGNTYGNGEGYGSGYDDGDGETDDKNLRFAEK